MALHISTNYYTISVPEELSSRATNLAYIAALAKRLNNEDLFNQAKQAYSDLYNYWNKEGSAIAKKKTSINWLGGGNKYLSSSLLHWDASYAMTEKFVQLIPLNECATELKKALSEL